MNTISQNLENEYYASENIKSFFRSFGITDILAKSNAKKEQGVSVTRIFGALIMMIFTGKSLNRLISEKSFGFSKDTVYRFLNSVKINWTNFLLILSFRVTEKIIPLTSEDRINTLSLDDSIFKRNRSKKVELLSTVMDHTDCKYYRGFRCLSAAFSDGVTLIPTGFNLLSSQNEKSRINEANSGIDKRTNGYKRRVEAQMSMYDAAQELVANAQKTNIPFSHVLFDSWFSMPIFFRELQKKNVHGIGMLKLLYRVFYHFEGKAYNLSDLHAHIANKIPKDKDRHSIKVTLKGNGKEIADMNLRIVFIHDNRAKNNWLAIATTDLNLSDDEIITLYSRRWDIEVFFKTCKQYLGFAKDFEGRSYDALTAQVAITFTRYIMLAVASRNSTDKRTAGDLFFLVYDELRENTLAEALKMFWDFLNFSLNNFFDKPAVDELLSFFIRSLPKHFIALLQFQGCES